MSTPILVGVLIGVAVFALIEAIYFMMRSSSDRRRQSVGRRLASVRTDVVDAATSARRRLLKDERLSASESLDAFLRDFDWMIELQRLIESAGLNVRVASFLGSVFGAGVLLAVIAFALQWGIVMSLIFLVLPFLGALIWMRIKQSARKERLLEQLPEALDLISRSVRAGYAFAGGMQMVAEELDEPVSTEFRRAFDERNLGSDLRDVMANLANRMDIMEARLFATAVLIQRDSGGNLAEVMDNLSFMIRERFRVKGKIKTLSAEGRLSAIFLIAIPMLVLLWLWFANPDYLRPLFEWQHAPILIGGAVMMELLGILWIRSIVNIEY